MTSEQSKTILSLYIVALLAGNLIPVLGVLVWEWDTFLLFFVFWIETGLIGGFTLLKMALALPGYRPRPGHFVTYRQAAHGSTRSFTVAEVSRLWILPAFVLGYATAMVFTAVLGVTLLRLETDLAALQHHASAVGLAMALLLVDQGIAFWRDYFGGPEWARSDPVFHMWRPLGRFALFYFLLLFGAPLAMATGKSAILAVFVVFKTIGELFSVPFASSNWTRD